MSSFFPFAAHNQLVKKATNDNEEAYQPKFFYDEVIRKNQEIIKTLLSKINDIYSRKY